ncbi:hypothetical protein FB451DRAFT_1185671 [Mycena latifolia]|nr:hypothetical protein FB451DRAFT_1185671 [Mycena latifolia]
MRTAQCGTAVSIARGRGQGARSARPRMHGVPEPEERGTVPAVGPTRASSADCACSRDYGSRGSEVPAKGEAGRGGDATRSGEVQNEPVRGKRKGGMMAGDRAAPIQWKSKSRGREAVVYGAVQGADVAGDESDTYVLEAGRDVKLPAERRTSAETRSAT